MSATFEIRGLAELKDALLRLPTELKGEATGLVMDAAYAAQRDIVAQYPTGPGNPKTGYAGGNLKQGVKVFVKDIGPFGVDVQVRSTAPHAWLWEHGRSRWGQISDPPQFVFIPTMLRSRRALNGKLAAMMRDYGLTVTFEV